MEERKFDMTEMLSGLQRIRRLYESLCRPVMNRYGLKQTEIDVLLFLANNPSCDTAREVTELRGMLKSQVCMAADVLTKRGLLCGVQDAKDRRVVHLRVLPEADPIIETAREAQRNFVKTLYRNVTEEERAVIGTVLKKIAANTQPGNT